MIGKTGKARIPWYSLRCFNEIRLVMILTLSFSTCPAFSITYEHAITMSAEALPNPLLAKIRQPIDRVASIADYPSFTEAITALNAINGKVTLVINKRALISSSVTVGKEVTLRFEKQGEIICSTAPAKITVNGPIHAGPSKIFDLSDGCVVDFKSNTTLSESFVAWWGTSTAAFQAAISASYGKKLVVNSGTYILDAALKADSSIEIELADDSVLDFSGVGPGTSLHERKLIYIKGTKGANIAIKEDVSVGDSQLTIGDTSHLSTGDYVAVSSDQLYSSGVAAGSPKRGFIARVKSVDSGTTLTLDENSPFSLAAVSNAKINKVTMVDRAIIRGGRIICGGTGSVHNGIYAYATSNLRIENVEIKGCEDTGITLDHSVNFSVHNNVVSDSTSPGGTIGNTGYCVAAINGSRDGLIKSNSLTNCRHAVAGGGSPSSFFIMVRDNVSVNSGIGTQAYDCHEPTYHWSFIGNRAHGGDGGFVIRGSYTLVQGNMIFDTASNGIKVQSFIADSNPTPGTRIIGNTVTNAGGDGIMLNGTRSANTDFVVQDNVIVSASINGISINIGKRGTIQNNVIEDITTSRGTTGNGIQLTGRSFGDIEAMTVEGNTIRKTLRHGLSIGHSKHVTVRGNKIQEILNSAMFLHDCEDIVIEANHLTVNQVNSHGVEINIGNKIALTRNRIIGDALDSRSDGIRAYAASGSNQYLSFLGNVIDGHWRHAVYTTNSDYITATGNHLPGIFKATKLYLSGARMVVKEPNFEGNLP